MDTSKFRQRFVAELNRIEARLGSTPLRSPSVLTRVSDLSAGLFRSVVLAPVHGEINRVRRVEDALRRSDSIARQRIVQKLAGIDLSAIWSILIQLLEDIALY